VQSELDKLFNNRIKTGHPPDPKKPSTVLRLLGFDLSQMDDDHRVWYLDAVPDPKADPKSFVFVPFHRYSLDTARTYKQSDLEHNNFLVCRPIPGKAEKSYSLVPPVAPDSPVAECDPGGHQRRRSVGSTQRQRELRTGRCPGRARRHFGLGHASDPSGTVN
jgi:hypothetical protein